MDPDLELLQLWRGGDRQAGDCLLARYFDELRRYFARRIPEVSQDDLVQEVFLRMIEARDRFEGRSTFRTYILRIARYVSYETLENLHRPNGSFDPLNESLAAVSGRSQSSILAGDEMLQILLDALQNIKSAQQEIIELHYFSDLKLKEIAASFDVSEGTAKSRMRSARMSLLDEFNGRVGTDIQPWSMAELSEALQALRGVVERGRPRDDG